MPAGGSVSLPQHPIKLFLRINGEVAFMNQDSPEGLLKRGRTYQEIVASDASQPPADLRETFPADLPLYDIERSRYTSSEFMQLEVDRMWSRTWQLACREEHIPDVGDVHIYEIAGRSLVVVRSAPDEIRAFHNSCLHRGTKLCATHGHHSRLRCPFHGFTWSLTGELLYVPTAWDFPQVRAGDFRLPEVHVARWQGFVFVNKADHPQPFLDYLEVLPSHFTGHSDYSGKYVAAHYRKILPANWKAALEAFLESLHITEVHPQTATYTTDAGTQYDVFPGCHHTSRFVEAFAEPVPQYSGKISQQRILDDMFRVFYGSEEAPQLGPGVTARAFLAERARRNTTAANGIDYSDCSDVEVLDPIQYFLFPNMVIFRGIGFPMVYRFLPVDGDPHKCAFDMFWLRDIPAGAPRPKSADLTDVGERTYRGLPGMPDSLGLVFDQDTEILALQQQGLRAGGKRTVTLSQYQESRIRHLHATLDRYLAM
jgi:phenylpropionate dioxygenase-like ring-hydroxylating dioxygenase large terminal subunit